MSRIPKEISFQQNGQESLAKTSWKVTISKIVPWWFATPFWPTLPPIIMVQWNMVYRQYSIVYSDLLNTAVFHLNDYGRKRIAQT